ncbi:MAG: ATP-binding protein [Candidatus Latescibacterota bacterium]
MQPYEKLGAFYLGRIHDIATNKTTSETLLYDSKDLLTHAVCVGMTGSGKTGLCITLLEEAAIDGIPSLVIDPKGDLTNLMLTFPDIDAKSFRPWINEDEARQKGVTADEFATSQAAMWRKGLKDWAQDGDRIQRLKDSAEFTVYTPGSDAGVPLSILSSFEAPPDGIVSDADLIAERTASLVTSLLALLGLDADPIRSREHILLSTLLQNAWQRGESLDLAGLIQLIQNPPISKIGVLELESFYPAKDRFELAMILNNLLASPRFQTWLRGEPIAIDKLLYTESGRPCVSIFSIAHLDEAERMFFVSLLLNQTVAWMRTRPGTTSLRAILYMDEIFGFMPPVANPPSKKPLLTLLKQARAYGVGLVLATQNPVDLDYKGLSNTGTWFIGRLQTERDKARMIEGLRGIGEAAVDPQQLEKTINRLGKRIFMMHNVHDKAPEVFHTRWAMSYLAGPMTRGQIKSIGAGLCDERRNAAPADTTHGSQAQKTSRPVLSPGVTQRFVTPQNFVSAGDIVYEPNILGIAKVHFYKQGSGTVHSEDVTLLAPLDNNARTIDWASANEAQFRLEDVASEPVAQGIFMSLPSAAADAANYGRWQKNFVDALYRNRKIEILKSATFKLASEPGESERDFRIRLADVAREARDGQVNKLRDKYGLDFERLDERIRKAEQAVEREQDQAKGAKMQTAVSLGATLLSAFLGRKATSRSTVGRATTTVRGMGRASRQAGDVRRARESLQTLLGKKQELSDRFEREADVLEDRFDAELEDSQTIVLKPRKSDIDVRAFALAWLPYRKSARGEREPLWR